MLVGAKVCDLTEDLLWFVCGLYVGILMSPLSLLYFLELLSRLILKDSFHYVLSCTDTSPELVRC